MTGSLTVRAVLVTAGHSPHLGAVIAAALDQTVPIRRWEVVLVGDAEEAPALAHIPKAQLTIHRVPDVSYARALNLVIPQLGADSSDWLWLLHDDTAPAPDALARLTRVARRRPHAGVIGATQVRWHDSNYIVNAGFSVARLGVRRIPRAVEGEVQQGQHDQHEDVLAVSLAAALVRVEAFLTLDGIDPAYGGFGESGDFCRRAWHRGYDVVLAPRALVKHSQELLYHQPGHLSRSRIGSARQRRTAEWYHALVWAPWWWLPVLLLSLPFSAFGRALLRLMQNQPRLFFAEILVPVALLPKAVTWWSSRRRIVQLKPRSRPLLGRLYAHPAQVWHYFRTQELGTLENWRAARTPHELIIGQVKLQRRRSRSVLSIFLLAHLAVTVALTVPFWTGIARGEMVTAPGLGSTAISTQSLWLRLWTGWSEQNLGAPALDGAWAALMLPLSVFPGGLRVGWAVLLVLAPLLAALGAYCATGTVTRSVSVRTVTASLYAWFPIFLGAVWDARMDAVLVHALLPWAIWSLVRAGGWQVPEVSSPMRFPARTLPSASAAMFATGVLTLLIAAAPVLLIPTVIILFLISGAGGLARWRWWAVGLLPLIVHGPGVWASVATPELLWRANGPVLPAGEFWGQEASRLGIDGMLLIAAGGGVAVALLIMGCGKGWRRPDLPLPLLLVGLGLVIALVQSKFPVVWENPGYEATALGHPAVGASLIWAGILWHAARGLITWQRRWTQIVATTVLSLVALAPLVSYAVARQHGGLATVTSTAVLPLSIPQEEFNLQRQRILVLNGNDPIGFTVYSYNGYDAVVGRAVMTPNGGPAAHPDLSLTGVDGFLATVAGLVADAPEAGAELAEWGIGAVVVSPASDRAKAALDRREDMRLAAGSESGTVYRIMPTNAADESAGTVSRAWLRTDLEADENGQSGITEVPMQGTRGQISVTGDEFTELVIAANYAPGWRAKWNGAQIAGERDEAGRQVFKLPGGTGELEFYYRDATYSFWRYLALIGTIWVVLGSVPLRSPAARGTR